MTALVAGLLPLPEGGTVDFPRLRRDRRQRLFEAMAAAGVDALMLGRPANVAFASGARQLWTAGTRPFSPACVAVAATGRVHLLSTWDEGVPPELSHRDLFGLSWNPAIALERLRGVEGLVSARRVATDGWGPGTASLVAAVCPEADLGDASRVLFQARAAKSLDEVGCLVTAAAAAEAALSAMSAALEPGVTERDLVGCYVEAVASLGLTCVPSEGVAWISTGSGRPQRVPSGRAISEGDLVALQPGASFAGYEVTVGRTRRLGEPLPSALATRAALDAVIAACQPGAEGSDLLAAWESAGGSPLSEPLAWGLGLGVEPPVIGPRTGRAAVVQAGMVLAVQGWRDGIFEQDAVLVGPERPTVLTRSRSGLPGRIRGKKCSTS